MDHSISKDCCVKLAFLAGTSTGMRLVSEQVLTFLHGLFQGELYSSKVSFSNIVH